MAPTAPPRAEMSLEGEIFPLARSRRGTLSKREADPGVLRYAVEAESEIESERASESEREEMISGRKRIGGAWALASIAVMLVAASFPAGVAAQDPSQAIPGVIDLG